MAPVCTPSQLDALLREVAFTRSLGLTVTEVGDGRCKLSVPYRAAFERPGGIVSGQVLMAAADVAMWLAIKTRLGLDDDSVTAHMTTNFLSTVCGVAFTCTAKIVKLGRRLVYGVAECTDGEGRLVAHHAITYMRRDKRG